MKTTGKTLLNIVMLQYLWSKDNYKLNLSSNKLFIVSFYSN